MKVVVIPLILKRHKEIIEQLLSEDQPITGEQLAKRFNVSARTIRSDVKALNEMFAPYDLEIESSRQHGYYLKKEVRNSNLLEKMMQQQEWLGDIPNTPEERMVFILLKLASTQDSISMEKLASEIYVSKATINYDVKKIIELLKSFPQIELIVSPVKGLCLQGSENTKRIVLSQVLSQEKLTDLGSLLRKLNHMLVTENINREILYIYDMIVGGLNEAGYSMTDSDVDLLTVDFLLSCKRIQLGFYAELPDQDINSSNLVQKFIGELERAFHIHVGAGDQAYLEQSFKAKRVMKMDSEEITIEDETKEISNHLMEEIQHKYGYDFTDNPTFLSNLDLHLNSMLHRIRRGQYQDNPLREEVKKNYPLAVEIATAIIPILQKRLHLVINESELTYIALHIAVALEEKIEKQRVAILCGSGLSTAQLVKRRLLSSFGDQIDIIGHFPLYQLPKVAGGEFGAVHLIITTLPIQGSYDIPIVHVNSLVTNEDVAKVNRFLNKTAYPITRDERACGYSFLDSELYVRFGNEGYLEGIACLCKKLHNTGYIQNESEFYDSVLKRETLYSTIMDCAVAIPHPMEAVSKKSVIAIGTFQTPIRYQGRKIKLILLFAVNTKEQDLLTMMYGKVEALLDSPGRINEAAHATTYDEFLEVFNKL